MASDEKCFTFTWKLENASYCLEKRDEAIYSPDFVVDSISKTRWYLGLFPRGYRNANYVSFYLYPYRDHSARKEIKYELAFVSKDGSCMTAGNPVKHNFAEKDNGNGFNQFAKREDVFMTKRSEFLPQDTLTTRCRIWKCRGEMTENIQCFARTRIGVQKRSCVWNLENFNTLESEKKYSYLIKSPKNEAPLMSISFFMTAGVNCDEVIRFELSLQDQTIKYSVLRLSLVDASGNKIECNQEEFWFDDASKSTTFQFFHTKNKLIAMKSSYLHDNILSMHWEWAFSKGVISKEIEDIQYACRSSESQFSHARNVKRRKLMSSYSLNDSLKSLYDENFLCDVKLKTGTRMFNAHKVILSASSSVFKAMFSSDMKEKDGNCVNIEDLSDDTISRMLLYIYTTRVEDLTWESNSHLYVAADKYAILSLKNLCSSYMKDNLSPSNACEVLLLSDFHADSDLKSAVQDYILKNVKDIINSDGWKLLMETNSKLAAETLCLQHK